MRKRDLHILTSNIYTYTGDQRFSVIHSPDSEDWDLKIEYPQKKDEGIYECQVNTEPKINLAVLLHVTGTGEEECLDLVFHTHHHKIARLRPVLLLCNSNCIQRTASSARTMFPVQTDDTERNVPRL